MRTVIVGDVHGCRDELQALFDHVGLGSADHVVMVGDLVVRGPDPRGVIDLVRQVGGRAVRGNHEDKLLRWKTGTRDPRSVALGAMHKATARELRKKDWAFLSTFPHWIELPEHGVLVVHAGVVPGLAVHRQDTRSLMYMRSVSPTGEAVEQRGRVLWGERYVGPPHVVFGHNAMLDVQIHPWATGLDTGCVYGGRLTAMVLRFGESPPPPEHRRSVLVSVPARKKYAVK